MSPCDCTSTPSPGSPRRPAWKWKPCGGQGIEPLLLLLAGNLLPAALAVDDPLLGGEAAQPLVDEHDRLAAAGRQIPAPRDRRPRLRPDRIVHVQRQPDDDPLDPL